MIEICRRGTKIRLIDEAVRVSHANMQDILSRFQDAGEIPVIETGGSHNYATLSRLKTPFELTRDSSHPIYNDAGSRQHGFGLNFEVPEVVAKWATPKAVQISLRPPIKPWPSRKHYPNWADSFGDYTLVVWRGDVDSLDPVTTSNYILLGGEHCRKQLTAWGVSHPDIEALLQ